MIHRNLPKFSLDQVRTLVNELYNIQGTFKELVSERDLSWRIKDKEGTMVIVKISNANEPEGVVDMQIKALEHIADQDPSLPVPKMILTNSGKSYEWITSESGEKHMLRLLTYLEGDVLEYVQDKLPTNTYYNVGALVGRMSFSLRGFFHPFANSNKHLWDIKHCLGLRSQLKHINDSHIRILCKNILDRAEKFTLPGLKKTRQHLIHQDAHGGNVLLDPKDSSKPVGIIDFGDMGFNSIVADIAVIAETYDSNIDDPLSLLCEITAGFDSTYPLEEAEINLVYDATLLRLAVFTIIASSRKATDKEQHEHLGEGKLAQLYKMLLLLNAAGRKEGIWRLREACRFPIYTPSKPNDEIFGEDYDTLFKKREEQLGPIRYFYERPMHFTRGNGAWLYAQDGKAYLDSYNNVPQFGHSHSHVVKAIARQARALNTNTRYMCDIVAQYAARLTADLPDHLDTCIFVNSGSEANDIAMQIAKATSGHHGGVIIENSYHGCTELSTALTHRTWRKLPKERWPKNMETIIEADVYKGLFADHPDAAEKYAVDTDRAIANLADRGFKPAAFIVDTAMCAHGLIRTPENYFNLVADKIHAEGGFVIADEVQAGCGRMGEFWGFSVNGLDAANVDFITMGKPVANAHPLGVVILSKQILNTFLNSTFPELFSTFGGNTVACAAGMAVLDVIERENLLEKSNRIGDLLRAELQKLAKKNPIIGDVRGKGMLIGVEFVLDRTTKTPAVDETAAFLNLMLDKNVLVGTGAPNVLKLKPSFAWDKKEIAFFIKAFNESLAEISHKNYKKIN